MKDVILFSYLREENRGVSLACKSRIFTTLKTGEEEDRVAVNLNGVKNLIVLATKIQILRPAQDGSFSGGAAHTQGSLPRVRRASIAYAAERANDTPPGKAVSPG